MPLAFSEGQLEQIKTFAYQLPRHLCSRYLHHLAQLLPRDLHFRPRDDGLQQISGPLEFVQRL
jgi:hypothetical protein